MNYNSLSECIADLERAKQLIKVKTEIDPYLEASEIHRRVFEIGGAAILFENIKGSPFRAVSNLFGTFTRTEFIFRSSIHRLQKLIELKLNPASFFKSPWKYRGVPRTAIHSLPRKLRYNKSILRNTTTISSLPQIVSWPLDGGAFITLPQVLTMPPGSKNLMHSNVGMYRIQISGNEYLENEEVGLHYQLHRGIGVHHKMYNESDEEFKVSIFIGGPPSHTFSAIMPLPEGMTELTFAGMLGRRRFRYFMHHGYVISADADFCITGVIQKDTMKPEGPFGDHLGYYSMQHDFPVMKVHRVFHRKDPIWPFTLVGRPPQEDSSFGHLIHNLVHELTPEEFPGLKELNAVDAAGVHPLLLAIGSERYMPFRDKKPEEILTIANKLLGTGQTSLAKFLIITSDHEKPSLNTKDISSFFEYVLERVDWTRDLHFQTMTTIDTLDYSGTDWNAGSKLVIACHGDSKRRLQAKIPDDLSLPDNFRDLKIAMPGILVIKGPQFTNYDKAEIEIKQLSDYLKGQDTSAFPLIIVCDDADFTSATLNNFLWVTFTRANPSHDVYGVDSFVKHKHWGCRDSLIIDSRSKPHHAPELIPNKNVQKKVDRLFSKGGELYGKI